MAPPISSQSDRSWLDAPANLGNHTRRTETTRPSDSVTHSASREHVTSTANVFALAAKVLMPFPKKKLAFSITISRISVISCDRKPRTSATDTGSSQSFA